MDSRVITDNKRCWTSLVKSTSRSDEKTCSDGSSDSNHLHVSVLQMTLELTFTIGRAELFIVRGRDGGFVLDFIFVRRHDELVGLYSAV